jgi:hypothetical protein
MRISLGWRVRIKSNKTGVFEQRGLLIKPSIPVFAFQQKFPHFGKPFSALDAFPAHKLTLTQMMNISRAFLLWRPQTMEEVKQCDCLP